MKLRLPVVFTAIGVLLCLPAQAQLYEFTLIADTSGPYSRFGVPAINAEGAVAFRAATRAGEGIFIGSGGPLTVIAKNTAGSPFSRFERTLSVNSGGTAAFVAVLKKGGDGIFTGGEETAVVATSRGPFSGFDTAVSINDAGTVAFSAFRDTGEQGIFAGGGGSILTVADTTGPFSSFGSNIVSFPSINNAGVVAFHANLRGGGNGIFIGSGGPTTPIADGRGPFSLFGGAPSINDAGTVAFRATLDVGGQGIFTSDGASVTTIATSMGPFYSFEDPVINAAGTVAFRATLDAPGGFGIFTGADPLRDKVIADGDPLFGSTVIGLSFFRGLNGAGQIAFGASLSNGRQVIARANVIPEPGSLALLAGALLIPGVGLSVRHLRPKR